MIGYNSSPRLHIAHGCFSQGDFGIPCRIGNSICGQRATTVLLGLVLFSLLQASSVSAEDPSDEIAFFETEFASVREGYVSLEWNPVDSAVEYVVSGSNGEVPYRGAFPQAFVSGLSDGDYTYAVAAFDDRGQQIATSEIPATVVVEHWPVWQAALLFGIGLVVFLVVIALILRGSMAERAAVRREATRTGVLRS